MWILSCVIFDTTQAVDSSGGIDFHPDLLLLNDQIYGGKIDDILITISASEAWFSIGLMKYLGLS